MLKKIKRQDSLIRFPVLPTREWDDKVEEYRYFEPKAFKGYTLTASAASFEKLAKNISVQFIQLIKNTGCSYLIFQCDLDTPWRYRQHDYKPARKALEWLAENKIGQKFNGALQISIPQLPIFLKHLCWMVRTNAVLPYVYFTNPGQDFYASICQYGNIHLSTITKESDKKIRSAIDQTSLQYITGNCTERFSQSGAIKGRYLFIPD